MLVWGVVRSRQYRLAKWLYLFRLIFSLVRWRWERCLSPGVLCGLSELLQMKPSEQSPAHSISCNSHACRWIYCRRPSCLTWWPELTSESQITQKVAFQEPEASLSFMPLMQVLHIRCHLPNCTRNCRENPAAKSAWKKWRKYNQGKGRKELGPRVARLSSEVCKPSYC